MDHQDAFVMVQGHCFYTKSEAALRVLRELGGLWPLLPTAELRNRFIEDTEEVPGHEK